MTLHETDLGLSTEKLTVQYAISATEVYHFAGAWEPRETDIWRQLEEQIRRDAEERNVTRVSRWEREIVTDVNGMFLYRLECRVKHWVRPQDERPKLDLPEQGTFASDIEMFALMLHEVRK